MEATAAYVRGDRRVDSIGFMISVVQDSCETALNSSTDVLLTAAGCPDEVDKRRWVLAESRA